VKCEPLTEDSARAFLHGICFKTGPPQLVGAEAEYLVADARGPWLPVDTGRLARVVATLRQPGALPAHGQITTEPGGQLELSSQPAGSLRDCVTSIKRDLGMTAAAAWQAGLRLRGSGLDPCRLPSRIASHPRYLAMEQFFAPYGPWGRFMMCSTASVQVCVDAGESGDGVGSVSWRWRLLHTAGPVLVAMFANSPMLAGCITGWKSTRQAVWAHLDPSRTRPITRQPLADAGLALGWREEHIRRAYSDYVLTAAVMCIRRSGGRSWGAPSGLTFAKWLRGGAYPLPTREDLAYHLTTLFPPVRPRGYLEIRFIDAQPGDGWIVPLAVITALLSNTTAGEQAMDAAASVWHACRRRGHHTWTWAAFCGLEDSVIATASPRCLDAAIQALPGLGAGTAIAAAVSQFAERYTARRRSPADDIPQHRPVPCHKDAAASTRRGGLLSDPAPAAAREWCL
jgi:glutamate--cysteine ligase